MHSHQILNVALIVGLLGLLTSTIYSALVVWGVVCFRRAPSACSRCHRQAPSQPFVSVLKPLHGTEPELEAHLETFFRQDYPAYELLFCARSGNDEGLAAARRIAVRYPRIPAKFIVTGAPPYANAKVASLAAMAAAAESDLFVISDSDVSVRSNYLAEVIRPFSDPMVGAVTCLYRGVVPATESAMHSLWARLEGVGMSVEMTSGVLVAALVEGLQFLLGPTMAVRRQCVEAIGGFATLGDYCSDDFLLGSRVARTGYDLVLSQHVIDHVILNEGFAASMKHQARWMRSTRYSRPKGHLGTGLTFSLPFALLTASACLANGHPGTALAAVALGVATRSIMAWTIGKFVLDARDLWLNMWLYPLRDLMGFGFWLASYTGNTILWRGETFELLPEGLMRRIHADRTGRPDSLAASEDREPLFTA